MDTVDTSKLDSNQNMLLSVIDESCDTKTKEQLEMEVQRYRKKIKLIKCQLQQTQSQMELQAVRTKQLVKAWQSQVEDAEERTRNYQIKRDQELAGINSQLMFLQGQLKKEQKSIISTLSEKDKTIEDKNQEIAKLKADNKRLQEKLTVAKRRRNKKYDIDDIEISLDDLTRYDSGLGFATSVSDTGAANITEDFRDFQKAYDTIKHRLTTTDSFLSSNTNCSELTSDNNIMEDDVFMEGSTQNRKDKRNVESHKGSFPDLLSKTGVGKLLNPNKKMLRRHSDQNMIVRNTSNISHQIYASPKIVRDNKQKFNSLPHKPKEEVEKPKQLLRNKSKIESDPVTFKSKHLSLDIDLNGSFDSVEFDNTGHDDHPWYSSDHELNPEHLISSETIMSNQHHQDISLTSSDKKLDSTVVTDNNTCSRGNSNSERKNSSSFIKDIFNTLRNKKRKRTRAKSLTAGVNLGTLFSTHSEPDIPFAEVNIDEAIQRKRMDKNKK